MKRFLSAFCFMFLWLNCRCYAVKPAVRLPRLNIVRPTVSDIEDNPIVDDEKVRFINSLMEQVWNEDFGKFTEFFCKRFFKLPTAAKCELETFFVTERTVLLTERLMEYLYEASTESCLHLFRCWIIFYKKFHCSPKKKEIIFDSLKEFVSRFSVEISRSFYITNQLLRERAEIMCELYDLEDKKTLSML